MHVFIKSYVTIVHTIKKKSHASISPKEIETSCMKENDSIEI